MEKKNWIRKFVPPCIQKGEVDLEGYVMVQCPSIQDMLEVGDRQAIEEKEGVISSLRSKANADWVEKYIKEVNFKDSEGNEIKSMEDLRSCNMFYKPLAEIVHAVINGDYGKKPLTKTA